MEISPETADDYWEVEALLDLTFAPGRTALSSYRLRDGVPKAGDFCLVLRDEPGGPIAGCIRYWPIRIGPAGSPALLLGPVAAHPTRQGEGIGGLLMRQSLRLARDAGWGVVVLVGDEPYYSRFGFSRALGRRLDFPPPTNPNRLLATEIIPGAMKGVAGMVRKWTDEPAA